MSVREWFGERELLITGATSQLGRCLLEKLLRSFPRVRIHLVLRSRDAKDPQDRLKKDILGSPGFERLRQERPNAADRIRVYEGDLVDDDLGLPYNSQQALAKVSVVFHAGGKSHMLLEFCRRLPNLRAVILVDNIFRCIQDEVLEELMDHDYVPIDLRLGIVRLPPVGPAVREPMPGYVDLLKAPAAIMVGAGHVLGCTDAPAEIIPIDIATNTLIVAAWDIGERKSIDEPFVYNASTIACKWGDLIKKGSRASNKYRYPSFRIRGMCSSVILHWFLVVFFEWLPSLICDTIFCLSSRDKRLVDEYNRVRLILDNFDMVTMRTITVQRHRIEEIIQKQLSPDDLEAFPLKCEFDLEAYILCAAAAVRKYCVSEKNYNIVRFFMPTIFMIVLLSCTYCYYFK